MKLTKLLKIELPIIQAPMAGGATTPELVAAVSNAGGLGSLGAGYMTPSDIRVAIGDIRCLTNKPFAVNLFIPELHDQQIRSKQQITMCHRINEASKALNAPVDIPKPPYAPSFSEQIQIIIEEKIPVFSFTFGLLEQQWIKCLKENGTLIIGTATSLREAYALEKLDVDIIVAQGCEAGGHRGTFIGEPEQSLLGGFSLIPQLVDNIKISIVAAGGIMNAKGVLGALTLGARGVQMGTAFLTCVESGIYPAYKKALLSTTHDKTVLTKVFSGKMARAINNQFIMSMKDMEDFCLHYPVQNAMTSPMRQGAAKQNNIEFMSLWAGQSAYLCEDISASDLIKRIKVEMDHLMNL